MLLGSAVLYHFLRREFLKGLILGCIVGLAGLLIFLIIYWGYCRLTDYPPAYMFEFSYLSRKGMVTSFHSLKTILHAVRWHLVWISPSLSALLILTTFVRLKHYFQEWKVEKEDFLFLFLGVCFGAYVLWHGMWGKYCFPAVFAGLLAAGKPVRILFSRLRTEKGSLWLSGAFLITFLHIFFVPSLQVRPASLNMQTVGIREALADPRNLSLVISVMIAVLSGSFLWARGKEAGASFLCVWLIVYALGANPVNVVKTVCSSEDRSPYRPLRDKGFIETVDYLNRTFAGKEPIVCPKDMGFYYQGKHYPSDHLTAFDPTQELEPLIRAGKVRFLIDSEMYPAFSDKEKFKQRSLISPVRKIGDYTIYEFSRN